MKNLQLRGRTWWVKKMVRGVLIHRSLETRNLEEAVFRMPQMIQASLQMKQTRFVTHVDSSVPQPQDLGCRVPKTASSGWLSGNHNHSDKSAGTV